MSSDPNGTAATAPVSHRRRRSFVVVAVALFVVLAGALGATVAWRARSQPGPSSNAGRCWPDPRLLYEGPFANVRPDVAYVGDAACTSCHRDIAASYHRHPMSRTLQPIADVAGEEAYDRGHNNPFDALGKSFFIERSGPNVTHRVIFADVPGQKPIDLNLPVHFAVGSGTHGRSYLTRRGNFLFQTPISWFSGKNVWDVSPGFSEPLLSGRLIDVTCLFCHGNRTNLQERTRNRFDEPLFLGQPIGIGCERCHGPGGRHVETTNKFDIVNPRAKAGEEFVLTPKLRDAVCEQCHLEGEERVVRRGRGIYDYRPGLPLEQFWSVFVTVGQHGEQRAVSHVEQMHQSRCYLGSRDDPKHGREKLTCVSCHDPHVYVAPAQQPRYYRGKCQACHADDHPCNEPRAERLRRQPDDSCIACHMPRFAAVDVAHTASTDHRIPRRPSVGSNDLRRPALADSVFVPFHRERLNGDKADLSRDLGITLMVAMSKQGAALSPPGQNPIALLELALSRDPEDVQAWTMKGLALMANGRHREALASFQSALQVQPDDEGALLGAALLTQKLGLREEGLDYWGRLVAVNPAWPMPRGNYARLLEQAQRWDEAREHCRAWLSGEPSNVEARCLWIRCLLHQGNKDEARRQLARLEALKPPNLDELRARFEKERR
jgi:hypothetical protein